MLNVNPIEKPYEKPYVNPITGFRWQTGFETFSGWWSIWLCNCGNVCVFCCLQVWSCMKTLCVREFGNWVELGVVWNCLGVCLSVIKIKAVCKFEFESGGNMTLAGHGINGNSQNLFFAIVVYLFDWGFVWVELGLELSVNLNLNQVSTWNWWNAGKVQSLFFTIIVCLFN